MTKTGYAIGDTAVPVGENIYKNQRKMLYWGMAEQPSDNSIVSPIQMSDVDDLKHISPGLLQEIAEQSHAHSAIIATAGIGEPTPVNLASYKPSRKVVESIIITLEAWLEEQSIKNKKS